MATITAVEISNSDQSWTLKWPAMGNADTGSSCNMTQFPDRTFGVNGTFGGATVVLQGSMDGSAWVTLNDFKGNAISLSAAGVVLVAESPLLIRPVTSGGSGTAIDVYVVGSRA